MEQSMIRIINCFVYLVIFGLYALSFIHETAVLVHVRNNRTDIIDNSFGGRFKYLTHMDAVF